MVTSNHHFRGPDWGVKWRGKYQNLAPQSPVKIVLERNLAHPTTATSSRTSTSNEEALSKTAEKQENFQGCCSLYKKFISAVLQQEFILKTACAVVITKKNSCCQTRSIQQNDSQRACTLNAQWMENNQPERYQRRILMPQPLPRYSERLSWKV